MRNFHAALHDWYGAHGRHTLPWRTAEDPYHIYLSEVMLQQTQVKTVLERFYFPFLSAFPSLEALASAPEEDVMKQWQGLGYYSRARNLYKAAQLAAPTLPNTYEGLIALPGIGKNTAHAILAFAYRKPYPVLEANVKRIIHRIFALQERHDKTLWQHAYALLDTQNPFDYNQAMMDVGAMICTPKTPKCDACPASDICKGKKQPAAYPEPKAKKQVPVRRKTLIALRDSNGRYYLTPRSSRFLGGLYHFVELKAGEEIMQFLGETYPLAQMQPMGHFSQTYSHFKLEAELLRCDLHRAMNGQQWFTLDEIHALPLSGAEQKAMRLLTQPTAL